MLLQIFGLQVNQIYQALWNERQKNPGRSQEILEIKSLDPKIPLNPFELVLQTIRILSFSISALVPFPSI